MIFKNTENKKLKIIVDGLQKLFLDRYNFSEQNSSNKSELLLEEYSPWISIEYDKIKSINVKELIKISNNSKSYPNIISNELQLNQRKELLCGSKDKTEVINLVLDEGSSFQLEIEKETIIEYNNQLQEALHLIEKYAPFTYERICILIKEIIFLHKKDKKFKLKDLGIGLSIYDYWGGVFLNPPKLKFKEEQLIQLILNLVHESGHQALFALQSTDHIIVNVDSKSYSPIRRVDRPLIRTMHANAAIVAMIEASNELLEKDLWSKNAKTILEWHKNELINGLYLGVKSIKPDDLTSFGKILIAEWIQLVKNES